MSVTSTNVSFGEGTSGGERLEPLPLRILAVADLSREGRGVGEDAPARTIRVDKDSFDSLFAKLSPKLIFEVPSRLLPGSKDVLVNLEIRSMKDFEGPALVEKIPELAALRELRNRIASQVSEAATPDVIAAKVRELAGDSPLAQDLIRSIRTGGPSPAPSSPSKSESKPESKGDGSIDSILSLVESDEKPAAPKCNPDALGSIISSVARGGKTAPSQASRGILQDVDAWVDRKIGEQLDSILHHPDFQSMESAWRGLKFLIERTDFRKDIVLEVLAARKEDLRKVLAGQVLQDEYDSPGEPPLALVLCDAAFDATNPDTELLNEIAIKCESIQAPLVAAASWQFFGRPSLHALGMSGSLPELLSGGQYTKWKALRDKEEMRWVCLTVNRFLLRPLWAGGSGGKSYPESADEKKGQGLLWGSGVWALGSCVTRSFAKEGWGHSISGIRGGGAVESLPLRAFEGRAGKVQQIPLETHFTETNAQDLGSAGLIALQSADNSDLAFFTYLPTVAAAKRFSNPAATQEAAMHAILPYQLFASRMAQWLGRFLREAAGAGSTEQLQASLQSKLEGVLGTPPAAGGLPRIRVEVSDHDKNPALYQVCLEIQPAFKFFGLTPRIQLAIAVAK